MCPILWGLRGFGVGSRVPLDHVPVHVRLPVAPVRAVLAAEPRVFAALPTRVRVVGRLVLEHLAAVARVHAASCQQEKSPHGSRLASSNSQTRAMEWECKQVTPKGHRVDSQSYFT